MAIWQENLLNYVIVIIVLVGLFVVVYCEVTRKTLLDVIKELKEAMWPKEE